MFAHKWNHECNNSNEMLLERKNNIWIFIRHAVSAILVIKLYYLAHLNYKLSRKCSNKFILPLLWIFMPILANKTKASMESFE